MISFTDFHTRAVFANMKKNLTFICLGVVFLASYTIGMVLFTYSFERKCKKKCEDLLDLANA